jgi:ABC-2 type transport system permease protein
MGVVFGGLITLATQMIVEREDGTLLRAKAVPNGMLGYVVGKLVLVSCMTIIGVALQLVPGVVLLDGLTLSGVTPWLMLAWVVVLGLIATLPLGAIIGSLFNSPRNMGVVMLPLIGLIGISGIFYPINNFPTILRDLAQVFPIYWLGLGMRSALLPDNLSAVEIGHSWRHLETFGVLAAWAVIGLVLAPIVLRRMARRESGSSVSARREAAMQRIR